LKALDIHGIANVGQKDGSLVGGEHGVSDESEEEAHRTSNYKKLYVSFQEQNDVNHREVFCVFVQTACIHNF
jgi:hypothetical protein